MELKYNASLYSRNALLKAAYSFTESYYIFLDKKEDYYIVNISPKDGLDNANVENEFSNELLVQVTRETVFEKTKTIRELILARAFASTIIEDTTLSDKPTDIPNQEKSSLFKDWYDEAENNS